MIRRGLPLLGVMREVSSNLRTGVSRATTFGMIFTLAAGALGLAGLKLNQAAVHEAIAFQAAGANVLIIKAAGLVDGRRCAAMGGVSGVTGAGALRQSPDAVIDTLPDAPASAFTATPGMAAVLGIRDPRPTGVWVAGPLAADLNARSGATVPIDGRRATVAGVFPYPDDGRDRSLAYSVVSVVPTAGSFDQCWVTVWPQNPQVQPLLSSVVDTPPGEDPSRITVGALNTTLGVSFQRPGAALLPDLIVVAEVVFGLTIGGVYVRVRRLELIGALHADVGRLALATQIVLETGTWLLAALAVVGATLWVFAASEDLPAALWLFLGGLRLVGFSVIATASAALLSVLTLRTKMLYTYFLSR